MDAEAQDGAGTDNANFATPPDGVNPRMQMFLWTGKGTHEVVVGATTFKAQGAAFGPALDTTGVSATVVLAQDGTAPAGDGCQTITTVLTGAIALIDRGTCNFTVKVKNAQLAGAVGAIIANNVGIDSIFTMGGADASITIPSVMVSKTDGDALKATLPDLRNHPPGGRSTAAAGRGRRFRHRLPRVRPRPDLAHDRPDERGDVGRHRRRHV